MVCMYHSFLIHSSAEKVRVRCFKRTACILSIVKQITSPGWMHETSARAWCTGKTQRDRVEREVGGGIGMGNTCISMADSCQCMTETTTKKKKKNTEVDCPFLLQGIFLTQGSKLHLRCLLHCRQILYPLRYWGSTCTEMQTL